MNTGHSPRLEAARQKTADHLLAALSFDHWTGELSSSPLSTASAVTALAVEQRASGNEQHSARMASGLDWMAQHQNEDGGWGDTTKSLSNLSTTVLGWAAFGVVPGADEKHRAAVSHAEKWLRERVGSLEPDTLAPAVIARYGRDRTFSVPILTMCALAGRLGSGRQAWEHVIPLPFELAVCPPTWFAALKLPVVSYALPALIAIGQARHHHRPSANPLVRLLRQLCRKRSLDVLERIQPSNGGFLEATPLTSFVTMSLAASGEVKHPVTQRSVQFLMASQRNDGSWPIDTNLATWITTLAVNALDAPRGDPAIYSGIHAWLLGQQYKMKHPYTNAAPGGWAWTDLPGGVPDADDTAGAVLALQRLAPTDGPTQEAARAGIVWLMGLQNSDGGIPTFCRGWGALPFDRSSADLTAHAIRAWTAWWDLLPPDSGLKEQLKKAMAKAFRFLIRIQRANGSWIPLWFGNQHAQDDENPTYGTAKVLVALVAARNSAAWTADPAIEQAMTRALEWLLAAQNQDGSWGGTTQGTASTEETALAIEAIATVISAGPRFANIVDERSRTSLRRGGDWLIDRVEAGTWTVPAPIGFYFAKLWYFERLYPVVSTVAALESMHRALHSNASVD